MGLMPLHHAARYGHVDCVKLLLQMGTNVSLRSAQRMTALHYAASSGSAAVVEVSLGRVLLCLVVSDSPPSLALARRCCWTAGPM